MIANKHLTNEDITADDREQVRDFYDDACHAEWCEYDAVMLECMVVDARLRGAAALGGLLGMAEAIRRRTECPTCGTVLLGAPCLGCDLNERLSRLSPISRDSDNPDRSV